MVFNAAIARLTMRQTLARKRWIIVAVLAAIPVVMATLIRAYVNASDDPLDSVGTVFPALIMTVVVPIIALVLASASLGAEVEDGTVAYLLTKPISRSEIVLTKFVVTSLIACVVSMAATLLAGLIILGGLDPTHLVLGFVAAAGVGSVLYTAIFLALGLITRRGMLIGLVYVIVWEGALGNFFVGTRQLSVRQYMLTIADQISTVEAAVFTSMVSPSTAYVMSVVVAVGAVALCVARLRMFEVGHRG